ncbi:MAG: glycosyltransferase family 4 protein [Nitrospinaceae bacterium]
MKITFLASQYARISGGNRALFEYANRLKAAGHEVRWIVLAKSYKGYRLDKKFMARVRGVSHLPPETIDWMDNSIPIEILPYNHSQYIPQADILLATAWQTADFAAGLPPENGNKFYFIQHHESLWTREKEQAEKTYRFPFRKMAISTWLKDILSEKYQQDADVLVTPVNAGVFHCESKTWNSPARVCMLHHDYDWKGYPEGIEAVRKVRSQNGNFELVVFGEKLEDPAPLFREAGFEFEYHYRPTRDRLREIYASSDIYLCPSWYEGLGMPAMEAMACRCALVTTDTGGCRDYANDGRTALVSPPKDPDLLAQNLSRLLSDEQLLKRLSDEGCKKIREFNWDDNCRHMIRLFEESLR